MQDKAKAKIQFSLGEIQFQGEGDETWVAAQLDKVLAKAALWVDQQLLTMELADHGSHIITDMNIVATREPQHGSAETAAENKIMNVNLAQFLIDKQAADNQVQRFLATAQWLHMRGNRLPGTRDVSRALNDNKQKPIGNPSDCLNKNVKKGYCKKDGKHFFVTAQGRKSLS